MAVLEQEEEEEEEEGHTQIESPAKVVHTHFGELRDNEAAHPVCPGGCSCRAGPPAQ